MPKHSTVSPAAKKPLPAILTSVTKNYRVHKYIHYHKYNLHTDLPDTLPKESPERHPEETSDGKTEPGEVQKLM